MNFRRLMRYVKKIGILVILIGALFGIRALSKKYDVMAPVADYNFAPQECYYLNSQGEEVPVIFSAGGKLMDLRTVPKDSTVHYRSTIKYINGENEWEIEFDTGIGIIEPAKSERKGKFAYWYTISDGNEIPLSDAEGKIFLSTELPATLGNVKEIYAKTYTPISLKNGNDNTKVTDVAYYGESFTLPEAMKIAAKRDHDKIWSYSAENIRLDAQGNYSNGRSDKWLIDSAEELEFVVTYFESRCTVLISSGSTESDVSGLPSTLTKIVFYGSEMPNLGVPTRQGYRFCGWLCVKGGQSVEITDRNAMYNSSFTRLNDNYLYDGDEVRVQPKWEPIGNAEE